MESCLVVLSGGQDSTTCLFWAKHVLKPKHLHAVTFNYGQKHKVEIASSRIIADMAGVASHEVIDIGPILIGSSPLVNDKFSVGRYASVDQLPSGVEPTFVPGRNALFLTIAANRAVALGTSEIITGVCEADFAGYFDCRRIFITKVAEALSEGIFGVPDRLSIHTPLMQLTKKQSVELATQLEGCMEALTYSHTCYNDEVPPCGECHACLLRIRGFVEAGVPDPLMVRCTRG